MKNLIRFSLFFAIIIITGSCKKYKTGITYPDSVYFGNNILSFPDLTVLDVNKTYELGAELEKNAKLSLLITNYSTNDTDINYLPIWFYDITVTGWVGYDYDFSANTQKFVSSQTGKIDLKMYFVAYGKTGKCRIDFFENSNSVTRTKYFTWK